MNENEVEQEVVVVRRSGALHWYRSDRELWVLDTIKWARAFTDAGSKVPESDPSDRFGIPVVDSTTASKFLSEMRKFEISKDALAIELIARFPSAESWCDVADLFPTLFVDFDREHVCAFYGEGVRIERYIPNGWTGKFEDFLTLYTEERFPQRAKFWVSDGIDMLAELTTR